MKIKYLLLLLIVVLIGLLSIRHFRLHDAERNQPEDVVRTFIASIQKHDYEKALTLLKYGDRLATEQHLGRSFEDFCRSRFQVETYVIEFAGMDKGAYVYTFVGNEHGMQKEYRIYVLRIDDHWRIAI